MKSYSISIPHFYCLEYTENNRRLKLDIDFRDPIIYLDIGLIKNWESPYDSEEITGDEKKKIIERIYKELTKESGFSKERVKMNSNIGRIDK